MLCGIEWTFAALVSQLVAVLPPRVTLEIMPKYLNKLKDITDLQDKLEDLIYDVLNIPSEGLDELKQRDSTMSRMLSKKQFPITQQPYKPI